MENFPGLNPETSPAESGTKRSKKRNKRRVNLSLTPILKADGASIEGASEKSTDEPTREPVSLDRELVKLMVRRKLEEGKGNRKKGEPESGEVPLRGDESSTATSEAELQSGNALEVAENGPELGGQAESDRSRTKERTRNDDTAYEMLPDYEIGANEFIGDVVISLRGPVEERVISPEGVLGRAESHEGSAHTTRSSEPTAAVGQSERSMRADDEETPTPGAGGGILPPQPPEAEVLHGTPDEPPEPSTTSEAFMAMRSRLERERNLYPDYVSPPEAVSRQAVEAENQVTREELDDAVYYATKAGQNRGVAAGLLAGAGYEHFKHKKREKKAEKRYQAQTKQLETTRQEYKIHSEEQEQRKNELERRLQTTESKLGDVEDRVQKQSEQVSAEKQPVIIPEQAQTEQLLVPPEHRVQTSAWHSIEIDAKTGRPVENPTFVYGEEYHRERAQENMPTAQGSTVVGETVVRPATSVRQSSSLPGDSVSLPPIGLPSASTQGPPPSAVRATSKTSPKPSAASQTTGPLWPWLVALLAIIISLVLILH